MLTTSFYFASLLSDLFTTTGIKGKVQSNLGKQATSIRVLSSTVQPLACVARYWLSVTNTQSEISRFCCLTLSNSPTTIGLRIQEKFSKKKLKTIVISKPLDERSNNFQDNLVYGCLQYGIKQNSFALLVSDLEI